MLYPQQNQTRQSLDLSGLWEFRLDPDGRGEADGRARALPAPRAIAVPGSWNEQFVDTRDYLDAAWYARTVQVPPAWRGRRVFLWVGSANYAARVWVNGAAAGGHEGGHLPFALDVTDLVSRDGSTRIAIRVDNTLLPTRVPPGAAGDGGLMRGFPATTFDFFPYGGLHRPVLLYAVPARHIADVTVVTTLDGGDGLVRVTALTNEPWDGLGEATLVAAEQPIVAALAFSAGRAAATLRVPGPQLWGPGHPHLYPLMVTLRDAGAVSDAYTLDVGIRTVEVRGDRLLLNGQPIVLKGFGKHEDFPIHGRGLDLPVLVKDHALLKWVGANSYRTSHYPYADEAMQLADREGVLIIDEIPAVGLGFGDGEERLARRLSQCRRQLDELIARDKNHPCVIMWSIANEPFATAFGRQSSDDEPAAVAGARFLGALVDRARSLDGTRPVTLAAMHGTPASWMRLCDVVCVNRYYGWCSQSGRPDAGAAALAAELDALHGALAKPVVITEFGADTIAGHHSEPPEMLARSTRWKCCAGTWTWPPSARSSRGCTSGTSPTSRRRRVWYAPAG
jgi:beta-glucuronidase